MKIEISNKEKYEFPVYFCKKCNRVWQKCDPNTDNKYFEYLIDFPYYGLISKDCPNCNRKLKTLYENQRQERLFHYRIKARERRQNRIIKRQKDY